MSYGKSWERYPIEEGQVWTDAKSGSKVSVADITKSLPSYMLEADMIYTDSPWSLGNVNMFNSKAGRDYMNHFSEFYIPLLEHIKNINPKVCFLEIGKQELDTYLNLLKSAFKHVQVWGITYYGDKECFLIRGGNHRTCHDYSGKDDKDTPLLAVRNEMPKCVADFCTGRGLTALAAHSCGVRFVGTELNKRKLAVCIDRCNNKGMNYANTVY